MELRISVPPNFSFKRTVISHGWCQLLPFEIDLEKWRLTRVLDLGKRAPVTVEMSAAKRFVRVNLSRELGQANNARVLRDCRHILRLDDKLEDFYGVTSSQPEFEWIAHQGAGRLLRSPTVFEDLVKMICTTNCSWSLTKKMVSGLVLTIGKPASDGRRTFPTAEAIAAQSERFFTDEVRAGYRAPYLRELAQKVAAGSLDVEKWLDSSLPTLELIKEIKTVKGVGNYAAENLLKLLGRYDGLALDSWTRAKFFELRNGGRKTTDKKIERYYARFKQWRGLALWCDMTRDWLE